MTEKIAVKIRDALKRRITVLGIGNRLKGDDGFGPAMAGRLKGKANINVFDAGVAPENFLGPIIKSNPQTIMIFDAADLGKPAGTVDILDKDDILKVGFSTHDASPAMCMDFLQNNVNAEIFMIAVQPRNTRLGEGLSAEVSKAIDRLVSVIAGPAEGGIAMTDEKRGHV